MTEEEIEWSDEQLRKIEKEAFEWQEILQDCAYECSTCLEILRNWPHETKTVMLTLANCMFLHVNKVREHPELEDAITHLYRDTLSVALDTVRTGDYLAEETPEYRKRWELLFAMEIDGEDYIPYNKDEDENND